MFRTELPIAPATDQLPRTARVLTLGSCFADSIGSRLVANKVDALVNPFGTVFQPLALARLLRAAAGEEVDWQQHLVEARGRWQSYDLHGSIGADSPVALLQTIQELVRRTGAFLRQADVVLLTLGTAWAYRLRETGELVSNCHKQPADLFVRELLTPDEIINSLAETHAYLRRINPGLRFVLTLSPVRHLKDTLPLNSVSKSVLRVATHIVSDLLPGVAYFPAYELLMDDLRDYRFYAADMLHPSEVAEEYIWDKFARTYFDADFGRFRKEWAGVRQSLSHRPLHSGAPVHRQFLEATLEKLEQLSLRKVAVADELREVRTQLAALPVPQQPAPAAEAPEDDEERIDIGEDAALNVAAPAPAEERPPRLSPEEFRAQRAARSGRPEQGRRDGRGKGQPNLPTENEQFQTAAFADDQADALPVAAPPRDDTAMAGIEQPVPAIIPSDLDSSADVEEVAKKKKRRSRGGAKRTARKNALRLAADETEPAANEAPENEQVAEGRTADAADGKQAEPAASKKSSVITKSVPVKRGGRRDERGQVPQVELFAAPATADAIETGPTADAELPVSAAELPVADAPVVVESAPVDAAHRPNRNNDNRNRGRKEASEPEAVDAANVPAAALPEVPTGAAAGTAEQLPGAPEVALVAPMSNDEREDHPNTAAQALVEAAPVAAARRSNRARRAVSAARPEKPAIDTPVIPVPDPLQVRTQVAAGRMTGSTASLITPTAAAAKATAVKKSTVPKKASTRAKAENPAPEPAPSSPAVSESLPQAAAPAPKPAAKPKPKAAKPSKEKTAAPEPAAPEPTPPKAAKPKAAAKSKAADAKAAALKPKAPRKPAKPA